MKQYLMSIFKKMLTLDYINPYNKFSIILFVIFRYFKFDFIEISLLICVSRVWTWWISGLFIGEHRKMAIGMNVPCVKLVPSMDESYKWVVHIDLRGVWGYLDVFFKSYHHIDNGK